MTTITRLLNCLSFRRKPKHRTAALRDGWMSDPYGDSASTICVDMPPTRMRRYRIYHRLPRPAETDDKLRVQT